MWPDKYTSKYVYTCKCVHLLIHTHIYIYTYMYTHTHTHTHITVGVILAEESVIQPSHHILSEHVLSLMVQMCRGLNRCLKLSAVWWPMVRRAGCNSGGGTQRPGGQRRSGVHLPSGSLGRLHEE